MIKEKILRNPIVKAWNLDLLGVMNRKEIPIKGLLDGMALVLTVDAIRGGGDVRYALIATGCDLVINFANRKYWLRRAEQQRRSQNF